MVFSKDSTLGQLLAEAKHWNAGIIQSVQKEKDKPVGAVVILRGPDTKAYLQALARVDSLLDEDSETEEI